MKTYKKVAIAGGIVAALGLLGTALPAQNPTDQRVGYDESVRDNTYGMMGRSSRFDVRGKGCCEGNFGTQRDDNRTLNNLAPADLKTALQAEVTSAGYFLEQIYVLEGEYSIAHLHDADHDSHLVWVDNQSGEVVRSLQGRRMMHESFDETITLEAAKQQAQKWVSQQDGSATLGEEYTLDDAFAFEVKKGSDIEGLLLVDEDDLTFLSFEARLVSVLVIDNK